MNKFIIHFHSGIAYLVLIGLLLIILLGITGILGNKDVNKLDRVSLKITKGLIHLQALAGIILWVVSDKIQAYLQDPGAAMGNSASRRTFIEHPIMMLIAVVIFTIGSKKIATAKNLLEKAAKAGFEWSTTAPLILKAEEALHAGNNEQALELVEKAILEANGSLAQRKYAEEHWQDHAIN